MFGFGDSIEPYPETVKLMDDLVKDFITNLVSTLSFEPFLQTLRSMDIAKRSGQDFDVESVRYAVRSKEQHFVTVVLTHRDYANRLDQLIEDFGFISEQTRYHITESDSFTGQRHRGHPNKTNNKNRPADEKQSLCYIWLFGLLNTYLCEKGSHSTHRRKQCCVQQQCFSPFTQVISKQPNPRHSAVIKELLFVFFFVFFGI